MKNRVVHFEIQADDAKRAMKFYGDIFGWEFTQWGPADKPYWFVMTAEKDSKEPGINGGLLPRPCPMPKGVMGSNAFVCTVQVDSFDEIAKKVEKAGGKTAMQKFAIPGMAWQGYFIDTEGNTFGLHQADPKAK